MSKLAYRKNPIKVKFEFVSSPDAEARIEAFFDLIFRHTEKTAEEQLLPSSCHSPKSEYRQPYLPGL